MGVKCFAEYYEARLLVAPPSTNEAVYEKGHIDEFFDDLFDNKKTSYPDTRRDIMGDYGRIQMCRKDEYGLYELQFLRLRIENPGMVADDQGGCVLLELEDGKYLAESASCLFDPASCCFVLQKNGFGAHIGFVLGYLKLLFREYLVAKYATLDLLPINENIGYSSSWIRQQRIKDLTSTVLVSDVPSGAHEIGMENMQYSHARRLRAERVTMRATTGRSKSRLLDAGEAAAEIEQLRGSGLVEKLQINYIADDGRRLLADFLGNRRHDVITVEGVRKKKELLHEVFYPRMKKAYLERIAKPDRG